MDLHKIYLFCLLINIFLIVRTDSKYVCPKQCLCTVENGYKLARCTNGNIADVNLEIPNVVEVYDLSGNSISKLDDYCFKNMKLTSLVKINLSNNIIFWIALHALAELDKLESLNLSGNRLQSLSPDLFWYNGKLKSLDLSGNKLWDMKNSPFLQHTNIKELNLNSSQISYITDQMFSELPSLTNLDLSKNYMINLKISALTPLKNLKVINLDDNQWVCDDDFISLQTWISSQNIEYKKQCIMNDKKKPKMFEKMISLVPDDREKETSVEDLDELWKDPGESNNMNTSEEPPAVVDQFIKTFPLITLIIGFCVGVLFGMVFSYCWLTQFCKNTHANTGRSRRDRSNEGHVHLISASRTQIDNESTPVVMRRQLSTPNSFCRSTSWELRGGDVEPRRPPMISAPPIVYRAIIGTNDRSESPPPTYRQCLHDSVIS